MVLGKAPVPGRVKTRLTRGDGALSPEAAARVAAAMMRATLERVSAHCGVAPDRRFLAIDQPDLAPDWAAEAGWIVIDQGDGSLGDRIARAWERVGQRPVRARSRFSGWTAPTCRPRRWRTSAPRWSRGDAAVGPVDDGGYWTLAAGRPRPSCCGASTGVPTRCTIRRAGRPGDAGVVLEALPTWYDVDHPDDLVRPASSNTRDRRQRSGPGPPG